MALPQLSGRIGASAQSTTGRTVLVGVAFLAIVFGILAWRSVPRSVAVSQPVEAVAEPVRTEPVHASTRELTDDQLLHLSRAKQELVGAAEQLVSARRQLSALSLDLNRNYLQLERRRSDAASMACEAAQKAIEKAQENIKVSASTERE